MNMGGGILLRTVARGGAGAGAGAGAGSTSTTPTASTGFCSACMGQVARPSSLRTTCRTCHCTALSHQAAASSNQADLEEWELAEDESANWPFSSSSNALQFSHTPSASSSAYNLHADIDSTPFENQFWHVFGLPPSVDEANVATSELQAAFFSSNTCSSSTDSEDGGSSSEREEWVEPQLQLCMSQVIQGANLSPVQEAFQLLQSDPNVKGAVISIVSDPEVWHAMMKNEKVQELKRIFQKSQDKGEHEMREQLPSKNHTHKCLDGVTFLLRFIVGMSRQVVWQVQDDISKIIMSILSLVTGPKCGTEKEDPFDKTMRSSMMIAVLVVTVVLMKRVQA